MFNDKILQIIPAPPGMFAWYKNERTGYPFALQIACLALIETPRGVRCVRAMDLQPGSGEIAEVSYESADFLGINFDPDRSPLDGEVE